MTELVPRRVDDPDAIWLAICDVLHEKMPHQAFMTWFQPMRPVSYDGKRFTVAVSCRFNADWIESHYLPILKQAVTAVLGDGVEPVLSIDMSLNGKAGQRGKTRTAAATPVVRPNGHESNLNERYRFENFIEGDCNKFARAAAVSIAASPGKTQYNPFLIYGGAGLGKTHLIQAIGNHILINRLVKRVLYVTSEHFTADFVNAIQANKTEAFCRIYRNVDVLLLDDVQFFMAKEKTQEEFFHTFNALHLEGKQLIFSSDRPPRDLEGFDKRLVSRLQWGLVSELQTPDLETRLAILNNLATEDRIALPDDAAQFIAAHVTDNIRDLQSALIQILAQSSLMKRNITMELVRDVVRATSNERKRFATVDLIQESVAKEFGIPSDLLRSKTRKKEVAFARHVAMYLCTEHTKLTLKAIGLHFGGRDHATVIHARMTIAERIKADSLESSRIEKLKRRIELMSL